MFSTIIMGVGISVLTLLVSIVYASLFEWLLHRYVMHRPVRIFGMKLTYAFHAHKEVHHHVFQADETYHFRKESDKELIPMAWWNCIVLVAVGLGPFALVCLAVGHWLPIMLAGFLGCAGYYAAYESLHWCMHCPRLKQRLVEKFEFFRRLNGHHILHHRYMGKNFNVVLPIWDWSLGTLMRRSPLKFLQVRGPSVPDLQPL